LTNPDLLKKVQDIQDLLRQAQSLNKISKMAEQEID